MRQVVLSLPHRMRDLLADDHARSMGGLRLVLRAVFGFYRRSANRGTVADAATGSVAFRRCFGFGG